MILTFFYLILIKNTLETNLNRWSEWFGDDCVNKFSFVNGRVALPTDL